MQPAERNYQIYDREMLAIIEVLKDWQYFLEGQLFLIIVTWNTGILHRTLLDDRHNGCCTFPGLISDWFIVLGKPTSRQMRFHTCLSTRFRITRITNSRWF